VYVRVTLAALVLAGCADSGGQLDLVLSLPPMGDLRPAGMTTVGITEMQADGSEDVATTQLVQDGSGLRFRAGEVAVGAPITLSAELRDATNRLVGFGAATDPVTPSASDATSVTIQVRKPIVYVASDRPIATIDPTRDALDPLYQHALGPLGIVVVPIDGNEVAIVTATGVQRIATATHMTIGNTIPLSFGMPLDAAPVPGQRRLVVGTTSGLVVVDIDTGTATTIPAASADRVAVGVDHGSATAYLLTGRVPPAIGATGTCAGSSTVYWVGIDGGGQPAQVATGQFADIAAQGVAVYGADPCFGTVKRLDSGKPALTLPLPGATAIAVQNRQLWAVGSTPYSSTTAASITLASIGVDGTGAQTIQLAPKTEIVTYDGDPQHELSIFLHADTEVPVDLAVLPGADQVALIARMDSHRAAAFDSIGKVIPEMQATVYDVMLSDPVTGATTRIRASCDLQLIAKSDAEFPNWSCATVSASEAPLGGMYTPSAIDAVYGGR
jgi:hypothetical protein